MKVILVLLIITMLYGCSSYITRYGFNCEMGDGLQLVQSSAKPSLIEEEAFGRYKFVLNDQFITLHLNCDAYGIGFYLINKTNNSVSIIWDSTRIYTEYNSIDSMDKNHQVSFYTTNRSQDKITPDSESVNYEEQKFLLSIIRQDSLYLKKPSIILPGKNWMDELMCSNEFLLPYKSTNLDTLEQHAKKMIGRKVKMEMYLKIEDNLKPYKFIFTSIDYSILRK